MDTLPSLMAEFRQGLVTYAPRENQSAISATNDLEAATTWLTARTSKSEHTFRAYLKELRRFITWLITKNLPLAEVKVEDLEAYFSLLKKPPVHWHEVKGKRSDSQTFTTQLLKPEGLSESSIAYTRRVLINLYGYLQDAGYVTTNPPILTAERNVVKTSSQQRYLDLATWQYCWDKLVSNEADCARGDVAKNELSKAVRYRWVFALLYHTGMRAEDASFSAMANIKKRDGLWSLHVIGKGNKAREITLNSAVMQELIRYRRYEGFPTDYPSPGEDSPLIRSLYAGRKGHLSTRLLSGLIREVAGFLTRDCEDHHFREQIENMTTHWMRHTNATHRLMAGASLHSTSDELGHSSIQTTRIYAKTSSKHRQEDAEKLADLNRATD
ncbi:tyrosine-type recombinase/integrase [Serratia symbiotica]|uniref:tyrosine-type recombinase/integrase n=1 Tax=Serratia symbiotica TaxID=138074 RepID=UPI0013218F1B|nr:tyrosine-type recombinase/integrase [Serratia symbiotica]QTP13404.1 tyrosine-type recombinase/integrase [Serratia symbiotica]